MLLALVGPDAGSIRPFGADPSRDPIAALQGVAGTIEEPRFYGYLSGRATSNCWRRLTVRGRDVTRSTRCWTVVTRNSVAAVAGTLLYAVALQGLAGLSAIASIHSYLLVDQLSA